MKKKAKTSLVKARSNKKIVTKKVVAKVLRPKKMSIKKKVVVKNNKPKSKKTKADFFSLGKVFGISALILVSLAGAFSLKPSIEHDVLSASTSAEPPLAPSKLVAKLKNSTVTITWADASLFSADKYVVYRYDSVSGKYIIAPKNQMLSESSKKYVSSQNDSGKTYLYKIGGIRLYYASGEATPIEAQGPLSQPISIKIPTIKSPKTPAKLKASVKNSQITLTWSGIADGFNIYRYNEDLKKYMYEATEGSVTTLKFSDRIYEPGKTYKFSVSAYNNVYNLGEIKDVLQSPNDATISVTIPTTKAPSAPTGLKSTTNGGVVQLTWTNPSRYKYIGAVLIDTSGVDGYKIMVYDEDAKEWSELDAKYIDFKSDRVVDITGQNAGVTKQYKIMGYKEMYSEDTMEITNLYGPYSKSISVKIP